MERNIAAEYANAIHEATVEATNVLSVSSNSVAQIYNAAIATIPIDNNLAISPIGWFLPGISITPL